jgi:hypothetical protein
MQVIDCLFDICLHYHFSCVAQALLAALAPKYQNSDTYTVELQPFFLNTTIPRV